MDRRPGNRPGVTRSGAATALLAIAASGALHAQEPPPRTIGSLDVNAVTAAPLWATRSVEVDAEPAAVFDYLSSNANWPGWFGDGIEKVEGDTSRRTFTLAGDAGSFDENIVAFEEPSIFAWAIQPGNPMGLENHLGVIEVVPDPEDGEGSWVNLSAFFEHADVAAILPVIEGGLSAIAAGATSEFGGQLLGHASGTDLVTIFTTRVAEAPRDAVWKVAAEDFENVAEWASVISTATFLGDDARSGLLGGTRECFIPAFGSSVKEKVVVYDEHMGEFAYEVLQGMPPFVEQGVNTWNVEAIDENRTRVSTTTTMRIAPGTPGLPIGLAKANFAQVLTISLDEFVHFVETGEPHPRELASR